MEIHVDTSLPFPPATAFATYRDELVKLMSYLPNVRGIDVKSRSEQGSRVEIVNFWRGGGDVPGPVRAILGESMLAWTDYATWESDSLRCDWRTETQALGDAFSCHGTNTFAPQGPNATRLEIRGILEIHPKKLRHVPAFLAGKIGGMLEEFLVARIESNCLETAKGLTAYLQERERAKPT
jgi:hypothetical protein